MHCVARRLRVELSPPGQRSRKPPSTMLASVTVGAVPPRRTRRGPARHPRSSAPRAARLPASTYAIEPPPAPIVWMSIIGTITDSPRSRSRGRAPRRAPIGDDPDVGARPSNVERRQVTWPPFSLMLQSPPITPPTGPERSSVTGRAIAWSAVAVPPFDCMRCRPPPTSASPSRAVELGDVVPHAGGRERVHSRRREPLELAELRDDIARGADICVGQHLADDPRRGPFVRRVQVRKEEQTATASMPSLARTRAASHTSSLVERLKHLSTGGVIFSVTGQPVPALREWTRLPGMSCWIDSSADAGVDRCGARPETRAS